MVRGAHVESSSQSSTKYTIHLPQDKPVPEMLMNRDMVRRAHAESCYYHFGNRSSMQA